MHPPRRNRSALPVLVIVVVSGLLFAAVALQVRARDRATRSQPVPTTAAARFGFAGQAAYAVGSGPAHLSTNADRPAPIASVAKVMSALVVLRRAPLGPDDDGPTFTVSAQDVIDTDRRRERDESLVDVREGEQITERQALMAMLLPSANNIAVMVTRLVSDSVPEFVRHMNDTARSLGMTHTRYTDPSGFDDTTVSTAADQLILARVAGADRELARMAATRTYRLPVAGLIRNTNTLLGRGTFVGLKTGSHDAAGGCFMFHARTVVDGRRVDVWGVVLGQQGGDLITAGLVAAQRLVAGISTG